MLGRFGSSFALGHVLGGRAGWVGGRVLFAEHTGSALGEHRGVWTADMCAVSPQ